MNDSIRELMDSCRPTGDDLRLPEMQPLADLIANDAVAADQFARAQRLDIDMTQAVHEVPIPAGLQERLLAAVTTAAATGPDDAPVTRRDSSAERQRPASANDTVTVSGGRSRLARSWGLWAVIASTAAALALIPLLSGWQPRHEVSSDELESLALNWELDDDEWVEGRQVWTRFPLPDRMFTRNVKRRQMVRLTQFDVRASCYDLAMPAGTSARVFVFTKPRSFQLPAAPPRGPMFTRGTCVAAWTSGDLAYVLVLSGGEEDYRSLFQRRSQFATTPISAKNLCATRTA